MRTLVVTENMTVDGRIQMLDDWFRPSPGAEFSDVQEEMSRQDEQCDAILLGRQTFEDFRGYWPDHEDEPAGASLAVKQKYVVSRTLTEPNWQHTTVLSGDPVDEMRRLKDSEGGEIVLTGSVTLCQTAFATAGLVDELRLFVYPALQGRGAGLLADGTPPPNLELLQSKQFRSGVTLLRYRVG